MDEMHACVVGSGTMGLGIAQLFARNGYKVTVLTHTKESAAEAREEMKETFEGLVEKDQVSGDEADDWLASIGFTPNYDAAEDCGIVIEAVPEVPEIKEDVFGKVTAVCPGDAVVASNTSSISITELSGSCRNPERFIGMHFFNPVHRMNLIEIVRGERTADETYQRVLEVAEELGKDTATSADVPGFISNRTLMIFINEAVLCLQEDVATKEDIDLTARNGFNHPMGPLQLADYIGLDVCLDIMRVLEEGYGEKFRPAELLVEKVKSGELGRKTGEGFYEY